MQSTTLECFYKKYVRTRYHRHNKNNTPNCLHRVVTHVYTSCVWWVLTGLLILFHKSTHGLYCQCSWWWSYQLEMWKQNRVQTKKIRVKQNQEMLLKCFTKKRDQLRKCFGKHLAQQFQIVLNIVIRFKFHSCLGVSNRFLPLNPLNCVAVLDLFLVWLQVTSISNLEQYCLQMIR